MLNDILLEMDRKTPVIRLQIEQRLSPQERKVLVCAARCHQADPFTFKELHSESRIVQSSHLSTIVGRLVKKGFLVKLGRSEYDFASEDLRLHLRYRHCGQNILRQHDQSRHQICSDSPQGDSQCHI